MNEQGHSTTEKKWRTRQRKVSKWDVGKNHQNMEGANGDKSAFRSPFAERKERYQVA